MDRDLRHAPVDRRHPGHPHTFLKNWGDNSHMRVRAYSGEEHDKREREFWEERRQKRERE
jgi:hypothetical protein